jgi:arylsulfatase A-like enzyme
MRWLPSACGALFLFALLADCGQPSAAAPTKADPASVSRSTAGFPLRVLESKARPPGEEHTLLVDEMDEPGEWLLVVTGADGKLHLMSAADEVRAGRLPWSEGHVKLAPGCALLRRATLAGTMPHSLGVLLRGPQARAGERCPNLFVLHTASASGKPLIDVEHPDPADLVSLAQAFAGEPDPDEPRAEGSVGTGAAWGRDTTAEGFTLARWLGWLPCDRPRGAEKWIGILALEEPLEVDRVRLAVAPELHSGSDASTAVIEAVDEAVVQRTRIGGDSRLAAVVPPGRVLGLPLDVPPEAVDVVLGTCPDPAAIAALRPNEQGRIRWTVRIQPGHRLLGQIDELVAPGQALGFTDHVLPWPAGVEGHCVLEFSVAGKGAMVFGQPRVRGPERPDSPSLLLISIDTLRADHVSALGYERPTTPWLEELAARGCSFEDVTAVSSYTLPTHASMFTGRFPLRHLALDTFDRVNSQRTPMLAQILSEAGYHTAAFTGGGFMSGDYGFDAGFDRYSTIDPVAVAEGMDGCRLEEVSDWIRRVGQRSWFAFVHTYALHDYLADPPDLAGFERAPAPEGFGVYELLDGRDVRANPPVEAEVDRLVDLYDGALHGVDRKLRDFLEPLRSAGLLEHTWVVVTSDHGEEFFEHGQLRHRSTLYQELLSVPLIIVPPPSAGLPGNLRVREAVSQVDLFSTLLELLGRPVPQDVDSRSLADYVRGGRPRSAPTPLYSHLDRSIASRSMLRDGSWKLVRSDAGDPQADSPADACELFDLARDAREQHDLAGSASQPLAALRARLAEVEAALRVQAGERSQFQPDAALQERLVQLGYVEAGR